MLNPPGRAPIRRVPARRVSDPAGAGPPGAAEAQDTMRETLTKSHMSREGFFSRQEVDLSLSSERVERPAAA